MNLISWILLLSGSIGIAIGLNIIRRQQVQIYRRGEIHRYEGASAASIGAGLVLAGGGAATMGAFDLAPFAMGIGILGAGAYFASRYLADRLEVEVDLTFPSQKERP